MFSFFKRDPLSEELKRAKKIKRAKDKLFWKKDNENTKKDKRIRTFLSNDICPECGKPVILEQTTDDSCTDNHYQCTKCSFEKHYFGDDEDDENW